jgi:F-type H+-transporting ATPase subunit delta
LGRATGKNVEVKVVVDESVIGGIIARVGDTVIDGSLARRVDSLRQVVES